MPDTPEKKWERQAAKALGGRRTGPRGFGLPDVADTPLAPECKLQGRLALKGKDLLQAKTNAERVGKPWVLLLKKRSKQGEIPERLAIMDYMMFIDWYTALLDYGYFGGSDGE